MKFLLLVALTWSSSAIAARRCDLRGNRIVSGTYDLELQVATDANSNGIPNYRDVITFSFSPPPTTNPWVSVTCYQNGVGVYGASGCFFEGCYWPWTIMMSLYSGAWTGGAADCIAWLESTGGCKYDKLQFHVEP